MEYLRLTEIIEFIVIAATRVIPAIISIISLIYLFFRTKNGGSDHLNKALPWLILILASICMLSQSWPGGLGLAAVCVAIIVMNKLKPE
jgi:hypothetical protein